MEKKLLRIHELETNKLYDMINNPFPNHILYYVDEEGNYCHKDLIVKTQGKARGEYNELIKKEFFEI